MNTGDLVRYKGEPSRQYPDQNGIVLVVHTYSLYQIPPEWVTVAWRNGSVGRIRIQDVEVISESR